MAVAVTFVLSLITIIGFIVFMQPRINKFKFTTKHFDEKDVDQAVGDDGIIDSTMFLKKKWDVACGSTTGLVNIPPGNYLTGPLILNGPCKASRMVVNVMGNVIAKPKSAWPNNSTDAWIKFTNVQNLVITGTGTGTGSFNGQGSGWWNCETTKTCENNPTALAFHNCGGLWLNKVRSINSPRNHISINACNGATVSNINIVAPWNSPNTDGIDISDSNGVNVNGGHIGTGDDCIAINGGSYNINITSLNCGPGHGISVGSLGRNGANDVVRNIRVIGATFTKTQNGVRIKTVQGGSGSASQITFSGITMTQVEHPIIVTQFYSPHADPKKCTYKENLSMVKISGVSFYDIHGTSAKSEAINISCSSNPHSCVGITLGKINLQPANRSIKLVSICKNADVRLTEPVVPRVVCIPAPSLIEMPSEYKDSQESVATT